MNNRKIEVLLLIESISTLQNRKNI